MKQTADKITIRDVHGFPCVINKQERKEPEWWWYVLATLIVLGLGVWLGGIA